jgi:hypothetical protein
MPSPFPNNHANTLPQPSLLLPPYVALPAHPPQGPQLTFNGMARTQLRDTFNVRRVFSSPSHVGKSAMRLLETSRCWMLRRPRICSVRLVMRLLDRFSHSRESMEGMVMGMGEPSREFRDLGPRPRNGWGGGGAARASVEHERGVGIGG